MYKKEIWFNKDKSYFVVEKFNNNYFVKGFQYNAEEQIARTTSFCLEVFANLTEANRLIKTYL